ncbi:MAG: DNA repair protein RecO [Pyrinomonadaceae bacterium]
MPLIETESLVIKTYNLAEADRIVVFLTREHGMVRGVAKGAKRLKSKFGSLLEPFTIVKLEYFQKEALELVSIQKIDLIQSNFAAASDPDFLQKFSYLGELLVTFSPPHDPNETLYRMVKACIETAAADSNSLLNIGVYFELWLLRLAGYLPDWSKCDECGRAFEESEETSIRANFHLVCSRCARSSGRTLYGSTRLVAQTARKMSPSAFTVFTAEKGEDLKHLSAILKQMISQSIGREVAGEKSLAIK